MTETEFNLLEEPWIRVMGNDCTVTEVSLTDALIHAHEFRDLAGELPTQNAAILRLLLAVLHAVFERVDENGEKGEIQEADTALDRWDALWKMKHFPPKPLEEYLTSQRENFWLFHPIRPFWQIPSATKGTEYEASKLNGSLSESSNKIRLFPERIGVEKRSLSYAEAARWLLYVNAYDDTSAKPTKEGKAEKGGKLPSPGAGWLGKIGFVSIEGENLYETLMLNLVLLDNNDEPWQSSVPVWELNEPPKEERVQIPAPNDQAALLTLQSRRLFLHRENNQVTRYYLLGGDFFDKENALVEQMTVWGTIKDKKGEFVGFQPKRHDKTRQMWRDFALYTIPDSNRRIPGVIYWNSYLQRMGVLSAQRFLRLKIASVQYGDKDFFAADVFSDAMKVHLNLLSKRGEAVRTAVVNEVTRCDEIAKHLGIFAWELYIAGGGDIETKNLPAIAAREKYYYAIDVPFREWLITLDAEDVTDVQTEKINKWRKTAKLIANQIADQMERDAGTVAFVGKMAGKEKDRRYYSTSTARLNYNRKMSKLSSK